ncbi:DUF6953 family protein [Lentzea flaviverrucosa]|uniref:HTH HARE-type domain-containing protein n=1 Tax=Lentzea flaviverrucosa TaxID=200379 RepID=A0A1H9NWA2_9PSEU|nr:hypothetical protein [Lentzea flaviverrucosa]RDI30063.1 hypothetical protein DFR72_105486 [Lentzea flaviverrucosa]SER40212.1 hypothetical protein SAMN05216195_10586 [Lentzea flaviverrucosa]
MAETLTAQEVAQWMANQVSEHGELYQEDALHLIEKNFGEEFTEQKDNGSWGIASAVLKAFTSLTTETVVWVKGERYWRPREDGDAPGRSQDA